MIINIIQQIIHLKQFLDVFHDHNDYQNPGLEYHKHSDPGPTCENVII